MSRKLVGFLVAGTLLAAATGALAHDRRDRYDDSYGYGSRGGHGDHGQGSYGGGYGSDRNSDYGYGGGYGRDRSCGNGGYGGGYSGGRYDRGRSGSSSESAHKREDKARERRHDYEHRRGNANESRHRAEDRAVERRHGNEDRMRNRGSRW